MLAIVIPIGGEGSRVSNLTKGKAKAELNIYKNKKIIDFQVQQVSKLKRKIIFLSNPKFITLNNYIKKKYNYLNVEILNEDKKLGTGGCLNALKKFNFRTFLIIYGDLIFNIDLKKIINFHRKKKSECTLVVHPNNHPFDSDCIELIKNLNQKKFF